MQRAFVVCTTLIVLTSCGNLGVLGGKTQTQPSRRILFIGNSYTSVNGGIDKQLAGLDPSSETARIDAGGYTLQNHWTAGTALQAIRKGGWNYVVLQEQSQTPIFDPGKFREFAGDFDGAIRSSGGKAILLMTWERPDSAKQGVTISNLATAYETVGRNLGATVAPAGLAFARSLHAKPDLVLYSQDGHPTLYGTYLAACVLYATIVGTSPVGNPYSDSGINSETSAFLQRMAAETLGLY